MHSVFWTLAKSNSRAAALQGADSVSAWGKGRSTDIVSPGVADGAADHLHNAFIQESTLDEIAFMGGADPLDLRRKLMAPYPVALRLIDMVELISDWKIPLPKGKARGFSFSLASGIWLAEVVQVAQQPTGIRIEKVFCAVDPGFVTDERRFRERMESDILKGLSNAIGGETTVAGTNPEIEIEVLGNSRHRAVPGMSTAPVAMSALANAVFALTARRIRSMPLGDEVTFV